ncbi:hypothetical protein CFH99_24445 [Nocardioides aromaticivorans]|uniref:ApeA N-terminal domain-containing protein n=1 Tax=Nocardioides aromaticivorans TaxID=200618 RepID=A0ABX7PRY9_9ACTN|nr:hypothetical protein [Nocardioides aromaticivorans]QSR28776.1 hypothetical protein CFH99_24445 [Nocardioides aromaticivorans]
MSVVAIYELPVPFWVDTATLGRRVDSGWRTVQFEVFTPVESEPVGAPPVVAGIEIPSTEPADCADPDVNPDLIAWTRRYAGFAPQNSTGLCRVVLRTAVGVDEYQLARSVDRWFDDVRSWVEAITGQDLDPAHRVYTATSHGAGLTVLDPPQTGDGPIALTLTTPRVSPLPAEAWSAVLENVALGVSPPLEELLSRDARAAFARDHFRRAIVDATTAVEIVLHRTVKAEVDEAALNTSWLRNKLRDVDRQPVGGLVTIAEAAEVDLGVDFERLKRIAEVRNDAIHRGEDPGPDAALEAVNLCLEFVGKRGYWRRTSYGIPSNIDWMIAERGGVTDSAHLH